MPGSSAVEQVAVNHFVAGSNPARAAIRLRPSAFAHDRPISLVTGWMIGRMRTWVRSEERLRRHKRSVHPARAAIRLRPSAFAHGRLQVRVQNVNSIDNHKSAIDNRTMSLNLTLLGTGTPTPLIQRAGSSYLVTLDNEMLLFDCGPG